MAIDERIRFLALGNFWHRPYADKLTGYANIWEIRVKSENVQYRPLGCCGPGDKVFSLLVGAREINKRFDPKDAPKIAEKREKLVYQDEGYLNEYC
ncbi:MAG: type II toxin-antitoxin system RelE/ParE family toxin [Deltaproteobacteria bacterium]|nr:type II toxin-antitoxin system RelE/ParE family toxin [Deltaproteobacteria bacterium]